MTSKFDFSKYSTNADVPRDRLYHPVKCEAERQWEGKSLVDKLAPRLSLLAPELSGGKGFGNAGGHKDRYRLQSEGPKTTTRKDTAHGDLQESEKLKWSASVYKKRLSEKRARDALQGEKEGGREGEREKGRYMSQFKKSASLYKESLREK